jgi:hypothetical protein
MSRTEHLDLASRVECLHVAELFERAHPGLTVTVTDFDRAIGTDGALAVLHKCSFILHDAPDTRKITGTGCKPGMDGIDFVMRKGEWQLPSKVAAEEEAFEIEYMEPEDCL